MDEHRLSFCPCASSNRTLYKLLLTYYMCGKEQHSANAVCSTTVYNTKTAAAAICDQPVHPNTWVAA